jgi:hypothetical protein
MNQDIEGVYSRMYRAMVDHKEGLISFDEMLRLWKEEARLVREMFQEEQVKKEEVRAA